MFAARLQGQFFLDKSVLFYLRLAGMKSLNLYDNRFYLLFDATDLLGLNL